MNHKAVVFPEDLKALGEFLDSLRKRKYRARDVFAEKIGQSKRNLSRIANGEHRPEPDTLWNWIREIVGEDKAHPYMYKALGLAGYIPRTVMPAAKDIVSTLQKLAVEIQSFEYPAYIIDHRGLLWVINAVTRALTGLVELDYLVQTKTQLLDLFWRKDLLQLSDFVTSGNMYLKAEQLRRFKSLNVHRQHEPFFRAYPDCMKEKCTEEGYKEFQTMWEQTNIEDAFRLVDTSYYQWPLKTASHGNLWFRTSSENVFLVGQIFSLVRHYPIIDPKYPKNRESIEHYLRPFREAADRRPCTLLWEHANVNEILEAY